MNSSDSTLFSLMVRHEAVLLDVSTKQDTLTQLYASLQCSAMDDQSCGPQFGKSFAPRWQPRLVLVLGCTD